ncbi:hypothetical protein ILYODFUR_026910 [Ilyodon furcidens]|uniref:Uncharacterized protein n=1 Tax=Ilyodon furcidens TaxID=33524 RepID=A0ABV0TM05_9TELE
MIRKLSSFPDIYTDSAYQRALCTQDCEKKVAIKLYVINPVFRLIQSEKKRLKNISLDFQKRGCDKLKLRFQVILTLDNLAHCHSKNKLSAAAKCGHVIHDKRKKDQVGKKIKYLHCLADTEITKVSFRSLSSHMCTYLTVQICMHEHWHLIVS